MSIPVAVATFWIVLLGLAQVWPGPQSPRFETPTRKRGGNSTSFRNNQPRVSTGPPVVEQVLVLVMTDHWWFSQIAIDHVEPRCGNLHCRFVSLPALPKNTTEGLLAEADGLVYHVRPPTTRPPKARSDAPLVLMSLESAANYPDMDNPELMKLISIEHSYRRCAQVYQPYYTLSVQSSVNAEQLLSRLQSPPLPFSEKLDAIMYVNSNCKASNARQDIMRDLQNLISARGSKLSVHSYGRCDRNVLPNQVQQFSRLGKHAIGRQYKFCVAMENSNAVDYVTEKVYDALEAGCVPIYYGAPNVADYVPDANGLVTLHGREGVAELLNELERLTTNETAYQEKLEWKNKAVNQLSPGFQHLYTLSFTPNDRCRLCSLLASHRAAPKSYSLCHMVEKI